MTGQGRDVGGLGDRGLDPVHFSPPVLVAVLDRATQGPPTPKPD